MANLMSSPLGVALSKSGRVDRYVRKEISKDVGRIVIRQDDRFMMDIRELMDTGLDVANAVLEVMAPTSVMVAGGGKVHRISGDKLDRAMMNMVSVGEDMAASNWGSEDNTVSNLINVVDGRKPRTVGYEARKRSKQSSMDMGIAANSFGEANVSCTRSLTRGAGSEPNACVESNVASTAVAADGDKMVRTEGCDEAIVVNMLIMVMGRMECNAGGEDATAAKKDAVRDGETCARKFGDEANLDTSVSSAWLGIALSTHGTEAVTLSSNASSAGSSAQMVFTWHVAASNASNRTDDGRARSAEGPGADNSVDSSGTISESLARASRDGVSRSLVSRLANAFGGICASAPTDDDSRPRNETKAGAGITFNRHGDDDRTAARAATYADGSPSSSVWEQSVFNTAARTFSGTEHSSDGDTASILANRIIIFVRGTTVVNVLANAAIVLTNTSFGSSANSPGVVIIKSTRISTSDDIMLVTPSGDFSGASIFADTDVGTTHGRDKLAVVNARRKCT